MRLALSAHRKGLTRISTNQQIGCREIFNLLYPLILDICGLQVTLKGLRGGCHTINGKHDFGPGGNCTEIKSTASRK